MSNDDLDLLRKRILLDFQVQRGSHVWAPWGKSGWSAVEVTKPSRKWAKGYRIKPKTGERGSTAKIPIQRLLKRDPDQKGADKPALSPDEVFAHLEEMKATEQEKRREKQVEAEPRDLPADYKPLPSTDTPEGRREREKRIQRLLDLLPDDSTTDDW